MYVLPAEKRPLKALVASPGFASPSTRLMQRDYGSSRDSEHLKHSLESAVGTLGSGVGVGGGGGVSGLEASTMGLLSTSGNEVLHYTFRPSKQIVSICRQLSRIYGTYYGCVCFNAIIAFFLLLTRAHTQSYATLNKKGITTCSPPLGSLTYNVSTSTPSSSYHLTPQPMEVSLLSPNNTSVTSSLSEYRFRPEVVTTSNRIQESCI